MERPLGGAATGGRSWPADCDALVVRIVMLSRLSTATPWRWIPMPPLTSGTYQGILRPTDVAFTPPDITEIPSANRARRPPTATARRWRGRPPPSGAYD